MTSIDFDAEALRRQILDFHASIRNNAQQALASAVKAAAQSARSTALFRDGPNAVLRNSITDTIGSLEGEVAANAKHARFVEAGTAPHEIKAKRRGTLRFVANGETIFRRKVMQPGTAPAPFMQEAADLGEKTLEWGLEYFIGDAIERFNASGT